MQINRITLLFLFFFSSMKTFSIDGIVLTEKLKNRDAIMYAYYIPPSVFTVIPLQKEDIKKSFYYSFAISNSDYRLLNDFQDLNIDGLISNIISGNKEKGKFFHYRLLAEVYIDEELIISFGFTDPSSVGNLLINDKFRGHDRILYEYLIKFIAPYLE